MDKVKLRRRFLARFWAKVNKNGPIVYEELGRCWLWLGRIYPEGYGVVWFRSGSWSAHRVSWFLKHRKIPVGKKGRMVLHKCDIPACVNPDHLFLGTNTDNMADKVAKGRQAYGAATRLNKITAADVSRIRLLRVRGGTLRSIGLRFGLGISQVHRIVERQSWKQVA